MSGDYATYPFVHSVSVPLCEYVCVCVCVVLLAHFLLLVQILNEILLFMVHVEQRVETILLQSFFG